MSHSNAYLAARADERCAGAGCPHVNSIKVCVGHAAKLERPGSASSFNYGTHPSLVDMDTVDDEDEGGENTPVQAAQDEATTTTKGSTPHGGLYEVWCWAPDGAGGGQYYRFAGNRQSSSTEDRIHMLLPAVDRLYDMHSSVVGELEAGWPQTIEGMRFLAYAHKWTKGKRNLAQLEGMDRAGATMTPGRMRAVRLGAHLVNRYLCNTSIVSSLTDAPVSSLLNALNLDSPPIAAGKQGVKQAAPAPRASSKRCRQGPAPCGNGRHGSRGRWGSGRLANAGESRGRYRGGGNKGPYGRLCLERSRGARLLAQRGGCSRRWSESAEKIATHL